MQKLTDIITIFAELIKKNNQLKRGLLLVFVKCYNILLANYIIFNCLPQSLYAFSHSSPMRGVV